MPTPDLVKLYAESDALDLARLVRERSVAPSELVEVAIHAIESLDGPLNAVPVRTFAMGRDAAHDAADGPFAGVPFLLKDIGSLWRGTPLTNGYPHLRDFVCTESSELSERIERAGFLVVGRTNTPEGGWSLGTEPRLHGPARNPYDTARTPGGSSGGAAAAVAARMVPIAEASDGGGSIRAPAACCGLVGLKPSRGRITYGPQVSDLWNGSVATFCVSRSVRDSAAYLDAVAGSAVGDPYILPLPDERWLTAIDRPPQRLRVGFTLDPAWGAAVADEVKDAVQATLGLIEAMGHSVEERPLPVDLRAIWRSYNIVSAVETATDMAQFEHRTGKALDLGSLAPVNAALVERGRSLSAIDHAQGLQDVRSAGQRIARALDMFDVFITPTLTQPPRPIGFWSMEEPDLERYLDLWADGGYLFACNCSGLPAISVPAAHIPGRDTMPIGVHLIGRHGDEATLLRLARQLEDAIGWQERRPPIRLA